MGTLRNLVINNVRCGNLIHCCYSVYELLEMLSESIPSEDREETVVLGKRASQPPVIGRWLIPPRARTASRVFLTRKHIVSQICKLRLLMRICLEAQPGELRRRQQLVFRDKSVLFSETTRPQTNVCTAIALESEEFGNYGHEFSKRRDSKFANLGALHVAHRYQDFSYAFSDIATSFWVAFEFGCEERVTIRGVVFFQEKTCNCDISSEDEEVVNPRTTMEANHRYVGWVAGAIFIQICVALETP